MREIGVFERRNEMKNGQNETSTRCAAAWHALRSISLWTALSCLLMVVYCYFFWERVSEYWFNPEWTSDDALQQTYPFHKVFHPELFRGDLITEMVQGYLPPIHYGLSWIFTWLTGDPMMMGHWLMFFQISLALLFLFLAVKRAAGSAPAFFAVAWMLHTRHVMQRMTAGLPRGWAPLVFSAYFYFTLSGNHWGMLGTLVVGCLLHPPATFVIAIAYGLYLVVRVAMPETRKIYTKHLIRLMLISPLLLVMTLKVLHRPERIGAMVTYEEALAMPEFQRPSGRFPFVPLRPAWDEIKSFAFQAYVTRFYSPGKFWKRNMPVIVIGLMALLVFLALRFRRNVLPLGVITFSIAATGVYFASRLLAFKLYVPDRHLQIPFAYVWITVFSIGIWRLCMPRGFLFAISEMKPFPAVSTKQALAAALGLMMMGSLVVVAGGDGLNGAMNFNFSRTKKGHAWIWLKENTPIDSLVAGHPTHLDSVFLFAARRGFVTTETAHPFYQNYNQEMKRRLAISLKAHYARTWREFLELLETEGIDYFVFERGKFYPEELQVAKYFPPLDVMTHELASYPNEQYVYRKLPREIDLEHAPYQTFRDDWSVVIDVKKLREYYNKGLVHD